MATLINAPTLYRPEFSFADPVQQLLLTTDGTLTELLEALHEEKLRIDLLKQEITPAERAMEGLQMKAGESVMSRKVLIKGKQTGHVYVFATSLIALDRMDPQVREGLLSSNIPLGILWKRNRVETFREVLESGIESAGVLGSYFDIEPDAALLARRTRVSAGGKPVALITEHIRYSMLYPRREAPDELI